MHQDFPSFNRTAHKQVPQITGMCNFMVVCQPKFICHFKYGIQNQVEVLMHDHALVCCHHIIKTALLVHAKCQRTVFLLVPKGILHFVAILKLCRALKNSFKKSFRKEKPRQQMPYLFLLQAKLFPVWHCQISTSATPSKMWAWRNPSLPLRWRDYFKERPLLFPGTILFKSEFNCLSRQNTLHADLSATFYLPGKFFVPLPFFFPFRLLYPHNPLVREIHRFHISQKFLTFFHPKSPFPPDKTFAQASKSIFLNIHNLFLSISITYLSSLKYVQALISVNQNTDDRRQLSDTSCNVSLYFH